MDPKIIDEKFEEIWKDLLLESDLITPQERPAGGKITNKGCCVIIRSEGKYLW